MVINFFAKWIPCRNEFLNLHGISFIIVLALKLTYQGIKLNNFTIHVPKYMLMLSFLCFWVTAVNRKDHQIQSYAFRELSIHYICQREAHSVDPFVWVDSLTILLLWMYPLEVISILLPLRGEWCFSTKLYRRLCNSVSETLQWERGLGIFTLKSIWLFYMLTLFPQVNSSVSVLYPIELVCRYKETRGRTLAVGM